MGDIYRTPGGNISVLHRLLLHWLSLSLGSPFSVVYLVCCAFLSCFAAFFRFLLYFSVVMRLFIFIFFPFFLIIITFCFAFFWFTLSVFFLLYFLVSFVHCCVSPYPLLFRFSSIVGFRFVSLFFSLLATPLSPFPPLLFRTSLPLIRSSSIPPDFSG